MALNKLLEAVSDFSFLESVEVELNALWRAATCDSAGEMLCRERRETSNPVLKKVIVLLSSLREVR
jgi:hypothetical protein